MDRSAEDFSGSSDDNDDDMQASRQGYPRSLRATQPATSTPVLAGELGLPRFHAMWGGRVSHFD
jgi:hypothetical protein